MISEYDKYLHNIIAELEKRITDLEEQVEKLQCDSQRNITYGA